MRINTPLNLHEIPEVSPMKFQLHTIVGNDLMIDDPYCAVSEDRTRVLFISDDLNRFHIPADETDLTALEESYIPTSRFVEFDLSSLEVLIKAFIRKDAFEAAVHFKPEFRQIGLTYRNLPQARNWFEYMDHNHEKPLARAIVEETYLALGPVLVEVFQIA